MNLDIKNNSAEVLNKIANSASKKLSKESIDQMLREIATTLAAEVRERVHEQGLDSTGQAIGTYSQGYMVKRTGSYKTKPKKDSKRVLYNRTNDTKVILSLTRQMENDFSTGAKNKNVSKISGGYGIGWKNEINFKKAQWNETRYKKKIFNLTAQEKDLALKLANEIIKDKVDAISKGDSSGN
jgi:hypothetical protein